jgi:hypothetical protein
MYICEKHDCVVLHEYRSCPVCEIEFFANKKEVTAEETIADMEKQIAEMQLEINRLEEYEATHF